MSSGVVEQPGFDDEAFLGNRVASFVGEALAAGAAALVIARAPHLAAIERRLRTHLDVDALVQAGSLALCEAQATLATFDTGEALDEEQFLRHLGEIIHPLRARGRIHAYGELAELLRERGRPDAAIQLEALWSRLLATIPVGVFHLSRQHVPASLARLEQRARALEIEIAHREQLEDRMRQLLEFTGALTAAHTGAEVAQLTIESGMRAVEATVAALWTVTADGSALELAAATDGLVAPSFTRIPLDEDVVIARCVVENRAVFLGSPAAYEREFPVSYARGRAHRNPAHVAYAVLPVVVDGKRIGGLWFAYDREREFTEPERAFKQIVARHCGLALQRVAALEQEQRARAEAEAATRAREEILSVVSHDLRNPLGTILIGASSLLQAGGDRRVTGIAERIHRQAERMARLIEDLVDFAGIQAGVLALDQVEQAPTALIQAATDLFGPLAEEHAITLETTVQPDLPVIRCDPDRALQVLANLMSNALKVTPKGGQVTIGARLHEGAVVFFVNDTGPGIDATELPLLFERYWRGKSSTYRGAGLGLSIARGIVDAHGGRIWAESTVGVGSTFCFSLAPPS